MRKFLLISSSDFSNSPILLPNYLKISYKISPLECYFSPVVDAVVLSPVVSLAED